MSAKLVFKYQVNGDRMYWVDFEPNKTHLVGYEVEVEKCRGGLYIIKTTCLSMKPIFFKLFKTSWLCVNSYGKMRRILNKITAEYQKKEVA